MGTPAAIPSRAVPTKAASTLGQGTPASAKASRTACKPSSMYEVSVGYW